MAAIDVSTTRTGWLGGLIQFDGDADWIDAVQLAQLGAGDKSVTWTLLLPHPERGSLGCKGYLGWRFESGPQTAAGLFGLRFVLWTMTRAEHWKRGDRDRAEFYLEQLRTLKDLPGVEAFRTQRKEEVMAIIKPTIGRVVWFWPMGSMDGMQAQSREQPLQASIAYVHSDHMINIGGVDHNGFPYQRTSVPLVQAGEERPSYNHCTWMPYQVGQAAQQEAKAARAAAATPATEGDTQVIQPVDVGHLPEGVLGEIGMQERHRQSNDRALAAAAEQSKASDSTN